MSDTVSKLDVKMGRPVLCLLCFYLMNSVLKCGHAEGQKVNISLRPERTDIPVGGQVELTCSVDSANPCDWEYEWSLRNMDTSEFTVLKELKNTTIRVAKGGDYGCRAIKGNMRTDESHFIPIYNLVPHKPIVTLEPNWTEIFRGEMRTLRCEIQGGEGTEWKYEWMTHPWKASTVGSSIRVADSGDYRCKGRNRSDSYATTEWSKAVKLTSHPGATAGIRADKTVIPAGDSATLTCSVSPRSPGWKYSWSRDAKPYSPQDVEILSSHQIRVSKGGTYGCRIERGTPAYHSVAENDIKLNSLVRVKPVLIKQPNWPKHYKDEKLTLTCEIEGGDAWEFKWIIPSKKTTPITGKMLDSQFESGDYSCVGIKKSEPTTMTEWSDTIHLKVGDKPKPKLTVSQSWLSPRDSVTLSCDVEDPSAGWRFYWYKAVPNLANGLYSYKPLPRSSGGTWKSSYTLYGHAFTAGYVCRAGRGDPVYFSYYSDLKFVWSGDSQTASLSVSPDRVQHSTADTITLSCKGDSVEWRVKSFSEKDSLISGCWKMTGSTCKTSSIKEVERVYWCESGSGEFSNAVNISVHESGVILVSPVHPVTEGDPLTLGCMATDSLDCTVLFYRNDKTIGSGIKKTIRIPSASKSDEGLYKCKCGYRLSAGSWVTIIRYGPSSLEFGLSALFSGLIVYALLCLYKRSQDPQNYFWLVPCLNCNQRSDEDTTVSQDGSQAHPYWSIAPGNTSMYESIDPTNTREDFSTHDYLNVQRPSVQPSLNQTTRQHRVRVHHFENI